MPQLDIESVLVAGRGPAACAVMRSCAKLGIKSVAVHSEAERGARHVRMADDAVLLGPAPATESYLAVDRIVEAALRSGVPAVLPVPPALAGNARLAAAVADAGLRWVGPGPEVLERLGGDGVEPASERGLLAWVTDEGLRFATPVSRDRAAGIARVSWTPEDRAPGTPGLPPAARRLADVGWRGLVTVGIASDGELAEVAAGFSLDMAVLERAHGVDAVELALRSAAGIGPGPEGSGPRAAVTVQLRSTLPPGTAGTVTGPLPGDRSWAKVRSDADVVAVSGYDPGDRLDGWYDALLATVSAAAPDTATAARAAAEVLADLSRTGVPHDGAQVRAVLDRLAAGRPVPEP